MDESSVLPQFHHSPAARVSIAMNTLRR